VGWAGTHDGLVVLAGGEVGLELRGDLVEAGGSVAEDVPGSASGIAGGHGAGDASLGGRVGYGNTGLSDDAGYGLFLLVERQGLHDAGEVFDGVELAVAVDDGDADGIDLGVEEVGAVAGGVHPEVVDDDGGGGFADVFADEAEVHAGVGSAVGEVGLVVELVGDGGVVGHLAGVEDGGLGKDGVEAEGGEAEGCAFLVSSGEKVLFGYGEADFVVGLWIDPEIHSGIDREIDLRVVRGFGRGCTRGFALRAGS